MKAIIAASLLIAALASGQQAGSSFTNAGPVNLTWSPNPAEDMVISYKLYEQQIGTNVCMLIADVGNVTNYVLQVPSDGRWHSYLVNAVNADGESDFPGCDYSGGPPVSPTDFCLSMWLIFAPAPAQSPTALTVTLRP